MSHPSRYKIVGVLGGAALAATSLAGVAGATDRHQAAASHHGAKVSLRHTSHGKVLVGPNGHSLYDFTVDTHNKSHCKAACPASWPPLMSKGKPRAGAGVKVGKLGLTANGQVTYYGHPLYYFADDAAAGQTRGEDQFAFAGYWYLVNAKGHAIF